MRYFLDTSFVIDYLRGHGAAGERFRQLFEDGAQLCVNEIVLCEAATGATTDSDPDLAALIEPLEFIQPGPDAALAAGTWRRQARRAGHTLDLADSLIAAAAVFSDAAVLTRNVRDFALTPARIETY